MKHLESLSMAEPPHDPHDCALSPADGKKGSCCIVYQSRGSPSPNDDAHLTVYRRSSATIPFQCVGRPRTTDKVWPSRCTTVD
jgi:hypothetical protein